MKTEHYTPDTVLYFIERKQASMIKNSIENIHISIKSIRDIRIKHLFMLVGIVISSLSICLISVYAATHITYAGMVKGTIFVGLMLLTLLSWVIVIGAVAKLFDSRKSYIPFTEAFKAGSSKKVFDLMGKVEQDPKVLLTAINEVEL